MPRKASTRTTARAVSNSLQDPPRSAARWLVPDSAQASAPPACATEPLPPARREDSGLGLKDYDWHPVLRQPRKDGWTPGRQRQFIEALADCGSVDQAARVVGMTKQACYQLRRAPGSEGFCNAWTAAIDTASKKLIDEAFERAIVGTDEPVFDRDGRRVGRRLRQSDRMLMFLLRAYMPERFRHASRDVRRPGEAPPIALTPVAAALERLGPHCPADPHRLIESDELEWRLDNADGNPGELPRWLRDPDPEEERRRRCNPFPMGEEFERELEDAKREGAGEAAMTDEEWYELRAAMTGSSHEC